MNSATHAAQVSRVQSAGEVIAGCSAASHRPAMARMPRCVRRTTGVSVEVSHQRSTRVIQSAGAPCTVIGWLFLRRVGGSAKPMAAPARRMEWNVLRRQPIRGSLYRRSSASVVRSVHGAEGAADRLAAEYPLSGREAVEG